MRILFAGDSLTEAFPGCSYVARVQERLPGAACLNWGRRNDTVVSLTRRLEAAPLPAGIDVAVVWIGVNDVRCIQHWSFAVAGWLLAIEAAEDAATFAYWYRRLLDRLCAHSPRVIALSSMFRGEDLPRPCNDRLDQQALLIEEAVAAYSPCELLDIRARLLAHLNGQPRAGYRTPTAFRAAWEALTVRTPAAIDKLAARRGLHLTFDGLHLNSRGADLVAEAVAQAITGGITRPGTGFLPGDVPGTTTLDT